MKFQIGDRVRCFGTDSAIQYCATSDDPYSVVGTVVRRNCHGRELLYKVEVDHSGSQDSEGHNAVLLVHEKQMEPLDQNPKPPAESDEKLRDELANEYASRVLLGQGVSPLTRRDFKAGFDAARANDPRVSEFVGAVRGLLERWSELEIGRSSTSYKILDEALRKFERRET